MSWNTTPTSTPKVCASVVEFRPVARSPLDRLFDGWADLSLSPKWWTFVDPSPECPVGRAVRQSDQLVWSVSLGEWTVLGPRPDAMEVVDLTHARAAVRITSGLLPEALSLVCALDFDDRVFPQGAAARTDVAGVATEIVRDDVGGERSYLVVVSRSFGQYLHGALADSARQVAAERAANA